MHVIDACFRRLSEISIPDLLGEIGVYVLWSGRAKARPSYIGEGNVLSRLVNHHDRFSKPFDGFAAVLSRADVPWQRAKSNATIVETLLLHVAHDTDRAPAENLAPGSFRALDELFERHGTARVNVSGLDPLRAPEESPRIQGRKRIVLRSAAVEDIELEHDWRYRRRRE
jgi:hypothetical protein